MVKTVKAVFDGKVFKPKEPVKIKPQTDCILTVETKGRRAAKKNAWDVLKEMSGTVVAPPDWSSEHDHYLYGTPKRSRKKPA